MQLLIYCPKVTPRIKYTFNFIFREVLGCDFEFTGIAHDFLASTQPKISYADAPLADELFFASAPLLNQHAITPINIELTAFGDRQVPFAVANSTLPFDVFAASFYFLSRYEEYLPFEADEHGRFRAELSLQYQLGLLAVPVIDNWALLLKNILLKKFPSLIFVKRKFSFVPTIDVDRAYHFRSSGFLKNTIRFLKAAQQLKTDKMLSIIKTGLGHNDPFDTYDYLKQIHSEYGLSPVFFFLLAKSNNNSFDSNLDPNEEVFKSLILETAQYASIGLHPSYASNTETHKISEELQNLEQISRQRIDSSRQHFIKVHLPQTYLQLIKAGINHDYSMGYPSQVGFRSGTCTSFFWYDLQLEKQTHLKIHPFALMDVTLQQYLKLRPQQAMAQIDELIANIRLVDGTFSSLWHNESLSDARPWKGWKAVYEHLLEQASQHERI